MEDKADIAMVSDTAATELNALVLADAQANADGLAAIAGGLAAAGLAPEGDHSIADTALAVFAQVAGLKQALEEAVAGASDLAGELATSAETITELTAERDALAAAVEKVKKAPRAKAVVVAGPRKVGPLKGEPLATGDLLELIQSAEAVELVFSDGARELVDVPAQRIEGAAWAVTVTGLALQLPELLVYGPAMGRPPHSLDGYGLLLDGELVAYRSRGEVLSIPAGMKMNLAQDVIF